MPIQTYSNAPPTLVENKKGQSETGKYYRARSNSQRRADEAAAAKKYFEDQEAAARRDAITQAAERARQEEALRRYNKQQATAKHCPSYLDHLKSQKEAYAEREAERQRQIAALEKKRGRKFDGSPLD